MRALKLKGAVMLASSLILFWQIFVICLLSLFVTATAVADSPIAAVNTENGLAVKGYDPVSYFTTGKPTPGSAQFSTTYNGATYRFSSAENRDRSVSPSRCCERPCWAFLIGTSEFQVRHRDDSLARPRPMPSSFASAERGAE